MPPTPNKPDPKKGMPIKAGAPANKPPAKPAGKPAPKKPAAEPPRPKAWGGEGANRKFGQVLVDLGFVDEAQLDELLFEVRQTDAPLEQLVLDRGLVNTEQLLQAKAEQFGLKVVNLEETKPTPDALKLVNENMAQV